MSTRNPPEFLERDSYRQRRLRDVGRALPLFAMVLFLLPLFWQWDAANAPAPSTTLIYIFGVWTLFVILAAILSRLTRFDAPEEGREEEG